MAKKTAVRKVADSKGKMTTDHDEIRRWAEERGGKPARVKGTGEDSESILRFDFGKPEEGLEPVSWEEFWEIFGDQNLALLYQEETAEGGTSSFFKFVAQGSAEGAKKESEKEKRKEEEEDWREAESEEDEE